jgi:AraC-like DNA-binding protein
MFQKRWTFCTHNEETDRAVGKRARPSELKRARLVKESQPRGQPLEDLLPPPLGEAQKRGFPNMRSILLPPPLIRDLLNQPLLGDLLVTRIGYCARATGHSIARPLGSLDHILHYCVAGKGWLRLAGREWDVPPETAFFIPRNEPHIYAADTNEPWSIYWIYFTGRQAPDHLAALQVSAREPLLHLPCTGEILSAFELVEGYMAEVQTRYNLVAASTALARLLGLVQLRRFAMAQRQRSEEENIQQTIELMRKNLAQRLSLRELAQLAHMSVSRYEATFVKRTGCSPKNYFNRMKIQQACRLLTESARPSKEICADLGFADPYYFSRLFKKLVGLSPAHFRKQHRAKAEI